MSWYGSRAVGCPIGREITARTVFSSWKRFKRRSTPRFRRFFLEKRQWKRFSTNVLIWGKWIQSRLIIDAIVVTKPKTFLAFVFSTRIVQNCALSELSRCTHNPDRSYYNHFSIFAQFFSLNGPSFFCQSTQYFYIGPHLVPRADIFIPKLYLRLLWFFRRTAALFRQIRTFPQLFRFCSDFGESWNPTNCEKFNADGSQMGRTNLDQSVW